MVVFLKKVRVKTIFSAFDPVKVEPLELCYLKTVIDNMGIENYIVDELFNLKELKGTNPDIVVLTGYNVAEEEIIKQANLYKCRYPKVKIIIGGVHIQGNSNEFHVHGVDYVVHTQSLNTFKILIENILNSDKPFLINGVDTYIDKDSYDGGIWHTGEKEKIHDNEYYEYNEYIEPDRNIFKQISKKLRYLEKRNVALIKGSIGCPYNCSYCYCKEINSGKYIKPNYDKMVSEMEKINADYFWIVDDVLFSQRKETLNFIDIIQEKKIKIKIIAYIRADFILKEKDLLEKLRNAGVVELIVGFEATNNEELKEYNKTTNALDYPKVISLLKENDIDLTALFMVQPDYKIKDFNNLLRFIKHNKIEVFTLSIFTPIKGTKIYETLKRDLLTLNPKKFDFMHLVLKSTLPRWIFYSLFYGIHFRLLKSKRIWRYILNK